MENRPRGRAAFAAAAALAFLLASRPALAQDEEIFFPFVSHLKTEVSNSRVKLTWKDPPGIPGQLIIYRGTEELTSENLSKAQLIGRVSSGVQYFIDTPPDKKGYFYAVLVQTTDGTVHSTLIPFRNKTLEAVSVSSPASEQEAAARVTNIRAVPTPRGDGIEVTFQASNSSRDLLLFRSTSPIGIPEDLVSSTSATQLDAGATSAVVAALPGVSYWFAVLDAGLYKLGQTPLVKGQNTTVDPVEVPLAAGRISLAPLPTPRQTLTLPSLDVTYGVRSGQPLGEPDVPALQPKRKVSEETEKAIAALLALAPAAPAPKLTPMVLPEEETPSLDRDAGVLQGIVRSALAGGSLEKAQKDLLGFLGLRRSVKAQARAHFYLGQIYYFQGRPRDALLEFLMAEDFYYPDVQPWENACILKLEKESR